MVDRWDSIAQLAVQGANVQAGQTVMVTAELDQRELAEAIAVAAYDRGARFVDVVFYDTLLKRIRVERADPETLSFVPGWYAQRLLELAEGRGARISLAGPSAPNALDGLDPALVGRDRLPWLKEVSQVIAERKSNWTIVPCPNRAWASLVYPDLEPDEAYERLWAELEHVLRLDEDDPGAAWEARMATLSESAGRLGARRFDAIRLRGPGTDLTVGLLPSGSWLAASFETVDGLRHLPNLPTEEVFTTPDPTRTEGHVTSTMPLVLRDGTIIRGLRVRFEGGRAVEIDADENVEALRSGLEVDENALRLGELALVDGQGRIGPLGTVFYETLLDENAASHIAFGSGFPFLVDEADAPRVNESGAHVDFMVGSPELEVDGLEADGTAVPVLRRGVWQI
ncbi:MAG TPA: aminopeptidase [Gaiellaceae bacterium]|jgi:aminopeptidase|nr:aminopeptidase [Gaiellaceae bacterium]